MNRLRQLRPSAGVVIGLIALFVALDGPAAALRGANSVFRDDIARNAVGKSEIRKSAVGKSEAGPDSIGKSELREQGDRDGGLTGNHIVETTLGTVPLANRANDVADPEAVRRVGAAGQPQFLSGCANSPVATALPVGFYKDREGVVHLQGQYQCPVGGSTAFALPAGYRPANGRAVAVIGLCAGGCTRAGFVNIAGAGVGSLAAGAVIGEGLSMSLDGITFRVAG